MQSAKRELREETGFTAKSIKKVGSYITFSGISSETGYVFLARGLKSVGQELEYSEKQAGLKIVKIKIKKAYEMLDQGKFLSAQTITPLSFVRKYLLKNE